MPLVCLYNPISTAIYNFLCQCKEFTPLKWICTSGFGVDHSEVQFHIFVSFSFGLDLSSQLSPGEESEMWKPGLSTIWLTEESTARITRATEVSKTPTCVLKKAWDISLCVQGRRKKEVVVWKASFSVRVFHWNLGFLAYLWQVISPCAIEPQFLGYKMEFAASPVVGWIKGDSGIAFELCRAMQIFVDIF